MQIDFYFDLSSPYSYLASEKIEALAQGYGAKVRWIPILLGAIFKQTGGAPLTSLHEWKASYSRDDFLRSAEFAGIRWQQPTTFPIAAIQAARAILWIEKTAGSEPAKRFALAAMRAYFQDNQDISQSEVVFSIATAQGIDRDQLQAALGTPEVKQLLMDSTAQAAGQRVFGVPMFLLNGERFWGFDRLPQLEARLKQLAGGKSYKTLIDQANAQIKTLTIDEARALYGQANVVFVDLRDPRELEREGIIPGALHAPRGMVEFWVDPKSPYYRPAFDPAKQFVFFCAAGWRSAITTAAVKDMGILPNICHLDGGFSAWKASGAPVGNK